MQDGEEAFLNFRRVVESANVIMATYADDLLGDTAVSPTPRTSLRLANEQYVQLCITLSA